VSVLGLTAGREMRETLRRRTYWIINAVLFLGACAAVIIPELIHSGRGTDTIAVIDVSDDFRDALRQAQSSDDTTVRFMEPRDRDALRRAVDDGDADIGVIGGDRFTIVVRAGEHEGLVGAAQQANAATELRAQLRAAGLSETEADTALATPPARVDEIDTEAGARRGAAIIAATVLYLLLLGLTISVANGVAIEKANRISEVLLAIVPARPLLFGKVLGVGLMGLLTLLLGIVPVAARLLLGGDVPNGIGGALASGAAWFALGLAFYLVMAGALAALVDRQEQAGSAMAPLMGALIASLIVAQSAPDTTLGAVLAYVPFSSPVVEPSRIAVGVSSPPEMVLSLFFLLLAVAIAVRFGGLVYQRAIVRTGRRLKLGEVLRAA
jgi:ABC-2 type transport system permease protein